MVNPDITISCEGYDIDCHKIFFTAASSVFDGMFKSGMQESQSGKVNLQCSHVVGKNLVKFFYTGEIEAGILEEEVESFLKVGDMYQVEEVKNMAEDMMIERLDRENMIKFLVAGEENHADRIRAKAKELVKMNLCQVMKREGWKEEFGEKQNLVTELMEEVIGDQLM